LLARAVLETELKFEIDEACAAGLIERLSLDAASCRRRLRTTYFDTPKGCLAKAGFVLRVRDDGRRKIQTIKQASADGGTLRRGEWEVEVASGAPDLKAARKTPLKACLKASTVKDLGPVFVVDVERAKCDLTEDGGVIEVALDRGEVRCGSLSTPIREIELELKQGSAAVVFAKARELIGEFPLNLSFVSKAERGRLLLEGGVGEAVAGQAPALDPSDSAAHAFRVIANGALAQVASNASILSATRKAEALHQMRVGIRRLRSALTLFQPMLAGPDYDTVCGELKWLAGEMDDARDLDVFLATVLQPAIDEAGAEAASEDASEPGFEAFAAAVWQAHDKAYDRALAAIGSTRCRLLLLDTLAWIDAGVWCSSPDRQAVHWRTRPIKPLADELLRDRRRKVVKTGRKLAGLSEPERHKLRIAGKKLRYAAGFFASLYPAKPHRRFGKATSDLQDALGALTDIAAGRALVERVTLALGDTTGGEAAAFAAGRLAGHRDADEAGALRAALKAFKRFEAVDRFW
jgi:triphosphatase